MQMHFAHAMCGAIYRCSGLRGRARALALKSAEPSQSAETRWGLHRRSSYGLQSKHTSCGNRLRIALGSGEVPASQSSHGRSRDRPDRPSIAAGHIRDFPVLGHDECLGMRIVAVGEFRCENAPPRTSGSIIIDDIEQNHVCFGSCFLLCHYVCSTLSSPRAPLFEAAASRSRLRWADFSSRFVCFSSAFRAPMRARLLLSNR